MNLIMINWTNNAGGRFVEKKIEHWRTNSFWGKYVSHQVTIKKDLMWVTYLPTWLRPIFNSGKIQHNLIRLLILVLKSSLRNSYSYNLGWFDHTLIPISIYMYIDLVEVLYRASAYPHIPRFILFATR